MSLVETGTNIAVGYFLSLAAQLLLFPLFGFSPPLYQNLVIGLVFTLLALIRGYALRRLFNRYR